MSKDKECTDENDEEEEQEEDDEDDEEEEGESEPLFRYERIGNEVVSIFSNTSASCLTVHSKFMALGTHWGNIYILDHAGNCSKKFNSHITAVNEICIDEQGGHIVSCSDDGHVVITGLLDPTHDQKLNFDRPVRAVALDPNFHKSGGGRQFAIGSYELILHEKGFLGRYKASTIHKGEGLVSIIRWCNRLIAWGNDRGVRIYDLNAEKMITFIEREHDGLSSEDNRCNLSWKDDETLLMSWGVAVKICVIRLRANRANSQLDLPQKYVEIVSMFKLELLVSGLAFFGNDLLLLTYDQNSKEGEHAHRPYLSLVEPGMETYKEQINQIQLSIRKFEECRCEDYHLKWIPGEDVYFVVSPRDIVLVRKRDMDDRVEWFVQHHQYDKAMEIAEKHGKTLNRLKHAQIGLLYLEWLLLQGQGSIAAEKCRKILGRDVNLWKEWVYKFQKCDMLGELALYVPCGDPLLHKSEYDSILFNFLDNDLSKMEEMLKKWPSGIFSMDKIIASVQSRLDRERRNETLLRCLGLLYSAEGGHVKALKIYLKLRHKDVFHVIERYHLHKEIESVILELMMFDSETASLLFIDHQHDILVDTVVEQLRSHPDLLHLYLHKLFQHDHKAGQAYHPMQVSLYAKYQPECLHDFLLSSNSYLMQDALEVCQENELIGEQVFLLGRMGNKKQALHLIITKMNDIHAAIDFCKEETDVDLWKDLINQSILDPNFVKILLQNIGMHINPLLLVREIREGMSIPQLRDSLVKILQDYNLQISLQTSCKKILVADSFALFKKLSAIQLKGLKVAKGDVCQLCQQNLINCNMMQNSVLSAFHCHHVYHLSCLPCDQSSVCPICSL